MRKTMKVAALIDEANRTLRESTHESNDCRIGIITFLEHILHATGSYNGFGYLTEKEVPAGTNPGINYDWSTRLPKEPYEERFKNCDDSRRRYYKPNYATQRRPKSKGLESPLVW